ncbi:MAG TPA: nucleoside hydrolase [Opitutaceae bacterium]|nr:nucleoside hydrolase [Opitutaceae bacterium]
MPRRKVIIDQDTLGPATTNLQSVAMLLQAPDVEVLGLGVPTGDHWRDQQVRHALRFLEIVGPIYPGAVMPLVATPGDCAAWEARHGKLIYNGAWDLARPGKWAKPDDIRDLPEGNPTTSPAAESAASFIARTVRENPGEVSLWCAGPLTNLALAIHLEPKLPSLVKDVHFMGGAFAPPGGAREFLHHPRREFNLRFDAEAARVVFRCRWPQLTCSPIDVSQTVLASADLFVRIASAPTPLARYLDQFGQRGRPLWDEVAAATWIDESLVTAFEDRVLDVELDRGPSYGDLLDWAPGEAPPFAMTCARVQRRVDDAGIKALFVALCSR